MFQLASILIRCLGEANTHTVDCKDLGGFLEISLLTRGKRDMMIVSHSMVSISSNRSSLRYDALLWMVSKDNKKDLERALKPFANARRGFMIQHNCILHCTMYIEQQQLYCNNCSETTALKQLYWNNCTGTIALKQ